MKRLLSFFSLLALASSIWAWNGRMEFTKDGSDGVVALDSDSNRICLSTKGRVKITDYLVFNNSSMCASSLHINKILLTPEQTREEVLKVMLDNNFRLLRG